MNKEQRASEAQRLLEHPLMREAFERLDKMYVGLWRQAKSADEREACWMSQELLAQIKGHLEAQVTNAKINKERNVANSIKRATRKL